jgi:hypothetical protein
MDVLGRGRVYCVIASCDSSVYSIVVICYMLSYAGRSEGSHIEC